MKVKLLSPEEAALASAALLAFAVRFGDSRLTASGLRELRRLPLAFRQAAGMPAMSGPGPDGPAAQSRRAGAAEASARALG